MRRFITICLLLASIFVANDALAICTSDGYYDRSQGDLFYNYHQNTVINTSFADAEGSAIDIASDKEVMNRPSVFATMGEIPAVVMTLVLNGFTDVMYDIYCIISDKMKFVFYLIVFIFVMIQILGFMRGVSEASVGNFLMFAIMSLLVFMYGYDSDVFSTYIVNFFMSISEYFSCSVIQPADIATGGDGSCMYGIFDNISVLFKLVFGFGEENGTIGTTFMMSMIAIILSVGVHFAGISVILTILGGFAALLSLGAFMRIAIVFIQSSILVVFMAMC